MSCCLISNQHLVEEQIQSTDSSSHAEILARVNIDQRIRQMCMNYDHLECATALKKVYFGRRQAQNGQRYLCAKNPWLFLW